MSNPALLVAPFTGDLAYSDRSGSGVFTGVDPVRYDAGVWLEQAGKNFVPNPVGAVSATGWAAVANISIATEPSLPGPLPGWLAGVVTTGLKITATADKTAGVIEFSSSSPVDAAGLHQFPMYIWIPTAFSPTVMVVGATNFAGAVGSGVGVDLTKRNQWQLVVGSSTLDAGDLIGGIILITGAGTMLAGEYFWITLAGITQGSYATSPIAETLGAGYANVGTAHNSASTRAASSASVATANHLLPGSGSLAFRFRRLIDTGGVEPIIECGTDGDDWFKAYIDADKLVAWWSSGGALPQYVTSVESIAVDTEYFIYIEWEGNTQALSINNGAKVVGSRDSVTGSWGAGDLVLKAE